MSVTDAGPGDLRGRPGAGGGARRGPHRQPGGDDVHRRRCRRGRAAARAAAPTYDTTAMIVLTDGQENTRPSSRTSPRASTTRCSRSVSAPPSDDRPRGADRADQRDRRVRQRHGRPVGRRAVPAGQVLPADPGRGHQRPGGARPGRATCSRRHREGPVRPDERRHLQRRHPAHARARRDRFTVVAPSGATLTPTASGVTFVKGAQVGVLPVHAPPGRPGRQRGLGGHVAGGPRDRQAQLQAYSTSSSRATSRRTSS